MARLYSFTERYPNGATCTDRYVVTRAPNLALVIVRIPEWGWSPFTGHHAGPKPSSVRTMRRRIVRRIRQQLVNPENWTKKDAAAVDAAEKAVSGLWSTGHLEGGMW